MLNPYKKGYRGERELVETLKRYFPRYRNKIKRIGGTEKSRALLTGDVFCPCGVLSRFHFENKQREKLNIFKTVKKTTDDAQGRIPVIRWSKSRQQPLIILREKDFLNILAELDGYINERNTDSKKLY